MMASCSLPYIPMEHGFLYLVAVIDWAGRVVLSWRLSNTMGTRVCIDALDEALARYGAPRTFNADQGAQFISEAFTGRLIAAGVSISMDGRCRFLDNIFIERLWRSIKYEEVNLKAKPMAVCPAAMQKIEAEACIVYIPLRFDISNALPKCPQRQKQREKAVCFE